MTIKRSQLKEFIKTVIREELSRAMEENGTAKTNRDDTEPATESQSSDNGDEPTLTPEVEAVMTPSDLREVLTRLGTSLTGEETDMLYKLNADVKDINSEAFTFADKETNPGVCCCVVECEPLCLYFRITPNGDQFDVEVIEMQPEFLKVEKRADRKFGDWIHQRYGFQNVNYTQLMELIQQRVGRKPLQETLRKVTRIKGF